MLHGAQHEAFAWLAGDDGRPARAAFEQGGERIDSQFRLRTVRAVTILALGDQQRPDLAFEELQRRQIVAPGGHRADRATTISAITPEAVRARESFIERYSLTAGRPRLIYALPLMDYATIGATA